jgi:hypothetical protein
MLSSAEFRTDMVSLPVTEADEVPACCFDCPCLQQKEFSTSEGAAYMYCSYHYPETISQALPPCLKL